jgi:hypothetical protein
MEKQISVLVAADGEVKFSISPGATVREVLQAADLQDYDLATRDGEVLKLDTDLFENADSYERFYATPHGCSFGAGD